MAHGFVIDPSWRALIADLGVSAEVVLRRAALPDDLLNRGPARLDGPALVRFAEALAAEVGDPLLPLTLGRRMSSGAFVPTVFAALCSPNLETAARRLALFKPLTAPVAIGVDRGPDALTLTWRWLDPTFTPPWGLITSEAVFLVELARTGTRHPVVPTRVTLPERPEPVAAYEAYFGAALSLGDGLAVSFRLADAERPFLTASQAMWEVFEPELRRRLADLHADATLTDRVRAVLLEALPSGGVAADHVARRLAVSERTLQRRLQDEGTTFKDVVRETRHALALHYLHRTRLSASEIAYLLGFEEPGSFFRAFRTWTGSTPEATRAGAARATAQV
jgi:AraC-like DNA-binding protein